MNRNELEHIIRASGEIAEVKKVIVFGSQSILAQFPDVSKPISKFDNSNISILIQNREILIRSIEADIMIPNSKEKTELVEGVMGELSLFHDTFGYYAQGVDLTTSKLPEGWEDRLVEICNENTNGISGMCLEIHDLMISKLYAGRKKDIEFFKAAVNSSLISMETLSKRLNKTSMSDERRIIIENYIKREL
ncbi:hypothetical protein H8E88_25275 [candidate division KSB1 bacterium]|nr:hypothetical protein [candidate division KSB1 bacterium]MBL7094963.1 hypothetical protein [candidate division KSB1 bacterium]